MPLTGVPEFNLFSSILIHCPQYTGMNALFSTEIALSLQFSAK